MLPRAKRTGVGGFGCRMFVRGSNAPLNSTALGGARLMTSGIGGGLRQSRIAHTSRNSAVNSAIAMIATMPIIDGGICNRRTMQPAR